MAPPAGPEAVAVKVPSPANRSAEAIVKIVFLPSKLLTIVVC